MGRHSGDYSTDLETTELMSVIIRPADLQKDKELLIRTLRRYLRHDWPEGRFDWLYQRNPHGTTRAWLATDDTSHEVVGTSGAFPRRVSINGKEKVSWVLGDFCIADKYRSLGPALQLQRATLAAVADSPEVELCYDFPSPQFKAVYQRLKVSNAGQMIRLAKPLRIDRKIEQWIRPRVFSKPASWAGNLLLRARDPLTGGPKEWDVNLHGGECGAEFTLLSQRTASANAIAVKRSADYLNWRYLQHPSISFRILTARRNGDLQGYLVFSSTGQDVNIAEWNTCDDTRVLAVLTNDLVRRLRRSGTMTLNAFLLASDPRLPLLRKVGFQLRESAPFVVYWPGFRTAEQKSEWLLMDGDRDT